MPSRAVDEGWHEFILDSLSYSRFCEGAWDRSEQGHGVRESVLWDLDRHLGIEEPFTSLSEIELISARTRPNDANPNAWAYAPGGYWSGGEGVHPHRGGGGCRGGGG